MEARRQTRGLLCLFGITLGFFFGCDNSAQQIRMVIHFDAPEHHVIKSGETLSSIAADYNATVEEVARWNMIEPPGQPGDLLLLWHLPPAQPTEQPKIAPTLVAARTPKTPSRRARTTSARPNSARANSPQPSPRTHSQPTLPQRPTSVREAGLFGLDIEHQDDGLADAVAGLEGARTRTTGSGLRTTRDLRNNTAERSGSVQRNFQAPIHTGPYFPTTPVRTPRLARPSPKRCLKLRARSVGDAGMYAGQGLNQAQIKSSMRRTLSTTRRCIPSGTDGTFHILVELTVGCDGRVKRASTINNGGVPSRITTCIETVLRSTAFPAHDLPDGQSFQYPIRYDY